MQIYDTEYLFVYTHDCASCGDMTEGKTAMMINGYSEPIFLCRTHVRMPALPKAPAITPLPLPPVRVTIPVWEDMRF